jgi:hypothetical protein
MSKQNSTITLDGITKNQMNVLTANGAKNHSERLNYLINHQQALTASALEGLTLTYEDYKALMDANLTTTWDYERWSQNLATSSIDNVIEALVGFWLHEEGKSARSLDEFPDIPHEYVPDRVAAARRFMALNRVQRLAVDFVCAEFYSGSKDRGDLAIVKALFHQIDKNDDCAPAVIKLFVDHQHLLLDKGYAEEFEIRLMTRQECNEHNAHVEERKINDDLIYQGNHNPILSYGEGVVAINKKTGEKEYGVLEQYSQQDADERERVPYPRLISD